MSQYKPDIGRLEAQKDIASLVDALHHPMAEVRHEVVVALVNLQATQALPYLENALRYETHDAVRETLEQAIDILMQGDNNQQVAHVQRLIQDLHSADSERIIEAARELGDLGDKLAVEPLVMCFRDARLSIQVRLAVAEALLKLESAPVEVTLLATLRHADWHIRRNGAAILGQLKAEWAIQPLFKALSDEHPVVRRTAQAALKHIGTSEARKALAWHAQESERRKNTPSTPAPHSSMLDRMTPQKPSKQPAAAQPDDETHRDVPHHARPAPPLHREVLPDARPPQQKPAIPRPRSIHEERKRRTQEVKNLSDTDRLRHTNPTAPLNPDVVDKAREERARNAQQGRSGDDDNQT